MLTDNPNANNPANNNPSKGSVAINPFRLDRSQAFLDCNNSNAYKNEQSDFDFGLMDAFPLFTGAAATAGSGDAVASNEEQTGTGSVTGSTCRTGLTQALVSGRQ